MAYNKNGRGLPGEDPYPDMPVHKPDPGYGADAGDVARGYSRGGKPTSGDTKTGQPDLPMPKGFLYRGDRGLDR